jgi:hypothetical protein
MLPLSNGYVHLTSGRCDTCNDSPVIESDSGDRICRLHAETHAERAAWRTADLVVASSITLEEFQHRIAAAISAPRASRGAA